MNDGTFQVIIRIWGLNSNNDGVYVSVYDYEPYIYLELPTENIVWNETNRDMVCKRIMDMTTKFPPCGYSLEFKYKLYYAHVDRCGNRKKFPYLRIAFPSIIAINYFKACVKKGALYVPGLRNIAVKVHEAKISPILKFLCQRDLSTAAWLDFKGRKIHKDCQESTFDHEYQCSWKTFSVSKKKSLTGICPKPKIMSFDLEANSSNPNVMPDPTKPNDKIFQISCIISIQGDKEEDYKKFLLSLGNPNPIPDTTIITFKSEKNLLMGFCKFIQQHNPNVLIGYNILGFDESYMIARAAYNGVEDEFKFQGGLVGVPCDIKEIKWGSAAYSEQSFSFVNKEGRLIVDMLPIVKRDYKLESYKLDSVAKHFKLSKFKQDLGHIGIFRCYREFTGKSLAEVGEYCVMDSVVCTLLFESLNTWVGLVEMANICKVAIFDLYTRGQQIKCFSQVCVDALKMNIVVEQDVYEVDENEKYVGAVLVKPKEGLYKNVLMFDFASLYPTIIIAYNICYTTLTENPDVPDSMCNILEWEDHYGCEHDEEVRKLKIPKKKIICGKHRNRFLKYPKGLLPTLVGNLLAARKEVRKRGRKAKDEGNKDLVNILETRQISIKVSANSMYGMMGVKKGFLPLTEGASSVTAAGRQALFKTIDYIERVEKGVVVYGDTDSVFAIWDNLKTPQECWAFSIELEKRFVGLFPSPMVLEFEEKIYSQLMMLSKKRYMAVVGVLEKNEVVLEKAILTKGVVLTRRDNCVMLRNLYRKIVYQIFDGVNKDSIMSQIMDVMTTVIAWVCPTQDFIISKSVKSHESYTIVPAHAKLADKLRKRGVRVDAGSRVPYILTTQGGMKCNQSEKIEDPEYFEQYCDILRIDRLYYISKLDKPIDELLKVAFGVSGFMKKFIKGQIQKQKVHADIKKAVRPLFVLSDGGGVIKFRK
jgi:DNA polymerase elongation subunit (family B)